MITRIWLKTAFLFALGVLLAWCPMPFGSVLPGSETFLNAAVLMLGAAGLMLGGGSAAWRALRAPLCALALLAAIGVLQSVSWPKSLATRLSPEHARLADAADKVLGAPAAPVALSLAPRAT